MRISGVRYTGSIRFQVLRRLTLCVPTVTAFVLVNCGVPERKAVVPPAPSAPQLLAEIESQRVARKPDSALKLIDLLRTAHPGTPEADKAAAYVPILDSMRKADGEAERKRAEKAAAEAEASRLANKWTYRATEDPMSGRTSRFASIQSENTVSFDFPYEGPQFGTLMVRDHPSYGRNVILLIERGQILCQSYEDCSIRIRFDNGSPMRWGAVGPADNSNTSVFLRNEDGFIRRFRAAKVVRLQIPVYQEGEPMFEFRVGGFDYSRFKSGQ